MIGKHNLKKKQAGRRQTGSGRYRRTRFEALERREVLSAPTLAALDDVTLQSGAPLHIALDGFDADGDTLTYSVEITGPNAGDITDFIPQGNRSMRITVAGYGEMVFELFEGRAPRATEQIIALAEAGFYDGLIFHRVIDNFMIQGGDAGGTGSTPSILGNFDDQFDVDLQHTSSGLLSMAKSTDDTNGTQFFITEVPTRWLDFQHTIFGKLIEGDDVREAISNVEVSTDNATLNRPLEDVVMESVEIFQDNQNGTLMIKAPEGVTGTATVTVTADDGNGNQVQQSFNVTIEADTSNGSAFLDDIPELQTTVDTAFEYQLSGTDPEQADIFYYLDENFLWGFLDGETDRSEFDYYVPVVSHPDLTYDVDFDTGLLTVTPSNGLVGKQQFVVAIGYEGDPNLFDFQTVTVYIDPGEAPTADLDMTLVADPTATDASGEVAELPESLTWIDEWDSFYVEIWASTPGGTDLAVPEWSFDLSYNTDYFSATSIEYGSPYLYRQTGLAADPSGKVLKLSGISATLDAGDDGKVLLARVYFEPTGNDAGVALDAADGYAEPVYDLGLAVENVEILLGSTLIRADVQTGTTPATAVWPVIYDLDDDGTVDTSDVAVFESAAWQHPGDPGATNAWAADFDRSGYVDFGDLAFLSVNMGSSRGDGAGLQFSNYYTSGAWSSALHAASVATVPTAVSSLSAEQLSPIAHEAYARLESQGQSLVGPALEDITFQIVDLPGNLLARASGNTIWIDATAAGFGWFVDATPGDDVEFASSDGVDEVLASSSDSFGKIDLLTAVMHEMGHLFGEEHGEDGDLMDDILPLGARRWLIEPADVELLGTLDVEVLDRVLAEG